MDETGVIHGQSSGIFRYSLLRTSKLNRCRTALFSCLIRLAMGYSKATRPRILRGYKTVVGLQSLLTSPDKRPHQKAVPNPKKNTVEGLRIVTQWMKDILHYFVPFMFQNLNPKP